MEKLLRSLDEHDIYVETEPDINFSACKRCMYKDGANSICKLCMMELPLYLYFKQRTMINYLQTQVIDKLKEISDEWYEATPDFNTRYPVMGAANFLITKFEPYEIVITIDKSTKITRGTVSKISQYRRLYTIDWYLEDKLIDTIARSHIRSFITQLINNHILLRDDINMNRPTKAK